MKRTDAGGSKDGRWPGPRVVLLLLGALVASQVAGEETEEQVLFKPGVFTRSEICGKCHQDIYKAWNEGSAHARSVTDPLFRGAVDRMRGVEGVWVTPDGSRWISPGLEGRIRWM
jgi:hypothetical protein